MQVAKWGNSLAVRLPKSVVDELGLKVGDAIDIVAAVDRRLEVRKDDRRDKALTALAGLKWLLPKDYRFDRDEANAR